MEVDPYFLDDWWGGILGLTVIIAVALAWWAGRKVCALLRGKA